MNILQRFWYGLTLPFKAWHILKDVHGRRFIFIPIILNIIAAVLMFRYGVSWYIIGQVTTLLHTRLTPEAQWMIPILTNLLEIAAFILITFTAVRVGTIIGSPFYVAVAERIDMHFLGYDETPSQSLFVIFGLAIWYEIRKLGMVCVTWLIGVACEFIPVAGVFIAPVWIFVTSGLIALLDYTDISLGRRHVPLAQRIRMFARFLPESIGFALIVIPCTAIPILNTLTVPLCICGGVMWYIERVRPTHALPQ